MEPTPEHDEEEMLASTLSNYNKATPQPEQGTDEFQRVNVLFAPDDLKTIDAKVHDLKALGLRWVNRSLLIRHALIPRRQCFEAAPPAGEASSAAHAFLDELLHDTRHVQPAILSMAKWLTRRARFDLDAAQQHLLAHIKPPGTNLRDLPPLAEDPRLDLIFKFVAAVFLQHAGAIQIRQPDADTILLLPGATAATITQARAVEGAT
jgi:hypothetical protein